MEKIRILFVCMGNICRSPTAQGCFQAHVDARQLNHRLMVDSCGTIATHTGEHPDRRSQKEALNHQINLSHLRARQIVEVDFDFYDYILVMDRANIRDIEKRFGKDLLKKVSLLLDWDETHELSEVPDPYYGGESGFAAVFELINAATLAFLLKIL